MISASYDTGVAEFEFLLQDNLSLYGYIMTLTLSSQRVLPRPP